MTAVTMRADQVRKGDKISLTAQVTGKVPSQRVGAFLITIEDSLGREQTLRFMGLEELSVERPDPDAELIEVMAKAIHGDDDVTWDEELDMYKDRLRVEIRAALAAAREAGLLPEVTP